MGVPSVAQRTVMFARLAMPEDEEAIVRLTMQDLGETLPHHQPDEAVVRRTFKHSIESGDPTIFVVEQDRHVIGFLLALLNGYAFTTGVYTVQEVLYVQPDKRGTRAAALLMDAFLAWSDRLGAKEVIGGNSNGLYSERTRKFLERFGFEMAGYSMKRVR
jgi:GNAT superfamily N-acetyltransferase